MSNLRIAPVRYGRYLLARSRATSMRTSVSAERAISASSANRRGVGLRVACGQLVLAVQQHAAGSAVQLVVELVVLVGELVVEVVEVVVEQVVDVQRLDVGGGHVSALATRRRLLCHVPLKAVVVELQGKGQHRGGDREEGLLDRALLGLGPGEVLGDPGGKGSCERCGQGGCQGNDAIRRHARSSSVEGGGCSRTDPFWGRPFQEPRGRRGDTSTLDEHTVRRK